MLKTLLPLVLLAVACGGEDAVPDYEGPWVGNLTQVARCPDGTTFPRIIPIRLTGAQDEEGVNFTNNTSCGAITTVFDGDVLRIQPVACDPLVSGSITYADTILGGTLRLQDDALEVDALASTVVFTSSGAGRCSGPLRGTLTRQ